MKGLVVKSTGSWYRVYLEDETYLDCRIKGKFRNKTYKFRLTNPLCVGDLVEVETANNDDIGVISKLFDRRNYIIRRSSQAKKASLLASNIDQLILIATIKKPRTSYGFIDRVLVGSAFYNIPCVILFNKIDLYNKTDLNKLDEYISIYNKIGYSVHKVSCETGENMARVRKIVKGKTSLISGHSGVGKSSMLNALITDLERPTNPISESWDKGVHTTTFSELIRYDNDSWLIDAPGIREFGIVHINEAQELDKYYKEIFNKSKECFYHDCLHENEPKCEVKLAVESGDISLRRYESYIKLLDEVREIKPY